MKRSDQIALARRLLALARGGPEELAPAPERIPVADYTSPERLRLETERLFREGPVLAGLGCDAREPGDYFTLDVAGAPVLVLRGEGGALRAFLNVCRHRGAQVAEGRGRARHFVCPYHAWRYDLGGRATPSHRSGFPGQAEADLRLTELPVAERAGLIFVRPAPGASLDLRDALGGAERELAPFHLEDYHWVETRHNERATNWKVVVDTFLEAYHLPSLHRTTLAPLFDGTLAVFDAFGEAGRLAAVRRSIEKLEGVPESEWSVLPHTTLLYLLLPNAILIHQQDHVELWQVYPKDGSVDRCEMAISLYTPEPVRTQKAAAHFKANMDLLLDVTDGEDFATGERMQRGFHTAAQQSVVFGRNEPGLIHYHRALRRRLGLEA